MRNDVAELPLEREIKAGPVTVNVEYNTSLAAQNWRPGVSKPLMVSLSAVNKRQERQKIYLTRATATVTAYDAEGPVDGPRAIVDKADLNPGFIATSPNTYNQMFAIPALDDSATLVTIDFTYEFAQEVDKEKNGARDFAKQVATDSIVAPMAN